MSLALTGAAWGSDAADTLPRPLAELPHHHTVRNSDKNLQVVAQKFTDVYQTLSNKESPGVRE